MNTERKPLPERDLSGPYAPGGLEGGSWWEIPVTVICTLFVLVILVALCIAWERFT